eukprot:m.166799 g.166799  ORF g.166799 m.166799 type:complete len:308 (-) comp16631_c0_seq4:4622-5545(-)
MESLKFLNTDAEPSGGEPSISSLDNEALSSESVQQLLQEVEASFQEDSTKQQPEFQMVAPTAGFCVKTDAEHGGKYFVNLCHSDKVPSPPAIADEELALAIAHMDNSRFNVPMSLGQEHTEVDKAGKPCIAYDVIINSDVFAQLDEREGMRDFLLELMLSYIESKHGIQLNRHYTILKRRKVMGVLQPQWCRVKTKVRELSKPVKLMEEQTVEEGVPTSGVEPIYTLLKEPETAPEFLILEVELPKLTSAATLALDVASDCVRVHARPDVYFLELELDHVVKASATMAQFNRRTQVLTITLQVNQLA